MMDFDSAFAAVLAEVPAPWSEEIPLASAAWRTLLRDAIARHPQPRFDNSAVDGFAIAGSDLDRLEPGLRIVGVVPAGLDAVPPCLESGTTVRVTTGARLPSNTAAVVMQEHVQVEGEKAKLLASAKAGDHVRREGAELEVGHMIARAGTRLTPPVLSSLAADGQQVVTVNRRPRVASVATGDELCQSGDNGVGSVFESNSIGIRAMLERSNCEVCHSQALDNLEATSVLFSALLEGNDILVSTGGVSVGPFDFVRPALARIGFETVVTSVAIKPGKPFLFAKRTSDQKVAFGLPGNPMSAYCTFHLFVRPYLQRLSGVDTCTALSATASETFVNHGDREEFVPCRLSVADGKLSASILERLGSHAVSALNSAHGYARLSPQSAVAAGELVRVLPFPWGGLSCE